MNENGHPATLVASQPGNRNAERTGAFTTAERPLEPHVVAMAEEVMALPHTGGLDLVGAIEIAKLVDLIDRVDADLAQRGITRKNGEPRKLLDVRATCSRRLADWLDRYGMNPKARADWARALAEGESLAQTIRRKREEAERAATD